MNLKEYCFLDSVIKEEFIPNTFHYNGSEERTTINGKKYLDPDKHSKELYDVLYKLWGSKLELKKRSLHFKYGEGKVTADYIGPSKSAAGKTHGVCDRKIGEFLKKTRTIGGHMIWPSKRCPKYSINTARLRGTCERMDITLYLLKKWYENKLKNGDMYNQYEGNRDWFICKQYNSFSSFVDFYQLNSYVNEDYEVYDLTAGWHVKILDDTYCKEISDKKDFESFIENSKKVIEERNELIVEVHKDVVATLQNKYNENKV